jgi:hypothetical protein
MEFNRPPLPTIINLEIDLEMKITLNNGEFYTKYYQANSFIEGNFMGIKIKI